MLLVDGNKIVLTRGDTATFELSVTDSEGNPYTPLETDEFIFTLKNNVMVYDVMLQKTFDSEMKIYLETEDTVNINFGKYFYDVRRVNTDFSIVDTFISNGIFEIGRGTNNHE